MQDAKRAPAKKLAPPKRSKGLLGALAGEVTAAASKAASSAAKPAPRRAPVPRKSAGDKNLLGAIAAEVSGTASGAARAVARGSSPAQTDRMIQRDKDRVRRQAAIGDYLAAPRAERSKQAARAASRVSAGRGSEKDKLIVQTHARRTRNDSGRSTSAVSRANAAHDDQVYRERVNNVISTFRKSVAGADTPDKPKSHGILGRLVDDAKRAPSDLVDGTKDDVSAVVKGAGQGAVAVGSGIDKLSKVRVGPKSGADRTQEAAGLDPTAAAKAALLPIKTGGNVLQVAADDPSQLPRAVKDIAGMVKDIPAGVIQSGMHPSEAVKATIADFKRRYGPLLEGHDKEFRERLKKEGIAPETVDTLGLLTGESAGGARVVSGVAKVAARGSKAGTRINRAANAAKEFVDAPRPDLVRTTNVAKPQHKANGLLGIAVQRAVDKRRQLRVQREGTEARAKRGKLPIATTKKQARKNVKLEQKVERPGAGEGVRGPLPDVGQVAPLLQRTRSRKIRKQGAVVASLGFRRGERLQEELTRPAERAFRALTKTEQRAAVHALEGTVNPKDPVASVAAIDRRIKAVKAERNRARVETPEAWDTDYAPLLGKESSDELVQLTKLRKSIVDQPDKVLSDRLRTFVEGEQARRPRVERVAGDSITPSAMNARRFAPLGELVGTRQAYVPRRAAVDRLTEKSPAGALQDLGKEIKDARASSAPARQVAQLQAEVRAVRSIANGKPLGRKLPAEDLDFARTSEAASFVDRTRTVAKRQGLGDVDPVFVKHKKRDTSFAGMRSVGGAEHGAAAGPKRSDLSLFRKGFRDTSDNAYASGIQESVKRSVQWRMVNELIQDHVPAWSKGENGKGLTRRQVEAEIQRKSLDPQDWIAWKAGREEAHPDSDLPTQMDPITEHDQTPLADITDPKWKTTDKFFLVPTDTYNEMKRGRSGADSALRQVGRVTSLSSQAILGTNPAYGVRQVLQTAPLTLVSIGTKLADPAFRRNWLAYRKAAKVNPDQWNDVLDVIGVRSKSADAVRSTKRGDKLDVKRFEGALVHTWGGLFGAAAKDYFVSPRRAPGGLGTASQVGRTAGKVALTPLRLMRDGNMMIDAWQDRVGRVAALAAQDARMSKGDAARFGDELAASTAAQAKRTGPLAAALQLPPADLDRLSRTPEFRRMAEEAADGVVHWLGDYANYTQTEQKVGRALVPFYGFARHSTRLLVYTLPLEHPFTFAAILSLSGAQERVKEQMLRDYLKKIGREGDIPDMLQGLVLTANGGGKLETIDARWLNPLTGPVFDALATDPTNGTSGAFTPVVKGFAEAMFETNLFTKQRLSNAQGASGPSNPLSGADKGRVILNRVLGSMFPFRAYNDLVNGEKGKLTDTSLPFDAVKYPYKSGKAKAKNDQKIRDARAQGATERLLDSVIPGRKKPATALLNSAQYAGETAGKKKPAPAKKKSSGGGSFGGSGFGSGGFGSGGGF